MQRKQQNLQFLFNLPCLESIITNCQHATLLTLCYQFSVWGLITRITILKPERSDT